MKLASPFLLLALLLAPAAIAATTNETAPSATWVSVAPIGLAYAGPPAEISLDVSLDGAPLASASRTLDGSRTPASLATLVAEARYDGKLTEHELSIELRRGKESLLLVGGQPSSSNGSLSLRVTNVHYPTHSPITSTGPVVFQVEHGWNDETLTVGFAWSETPRGHVVVLLEADGDGTSIREEANASAREGDAWQARFHLDRLPAVLVWRATIIVDGDAVGTTGSTVAFPTKSASDGFFSPMPGSALVAAGGFHQVGGHKETISIDRAVLAPVFLGSTGCPEKGAYDTVNGETWRIASLATKADDCSMPDVIEPATSAPSGEAASTTDEVRPLGGSFTPLLLLKVLLGLFALLLVAYVVVAYRRRRTP